MSEPQPELLPIPDRELTVNEVVSYNLMRVRRLRAWTQHEVARLLGTYTGRSTSNASVSAAERAWQGGRTRRFDADEIMAFSRVFDVPIAYFFLPPSPTDGDCEITTAPQPQGHHGNSKTCPPIEYLKWTLGIDPPLDFVERAQSLIRHHTALDFFSAKWEHGPAADYHRGIRDWTAGEERSSQSPDTKRSPEADHEVRDIAQEIASVIIDKLREQGIAITRGPMRPGATVGERVQMARKRARLSVQDLSKRTYIDAWKIEAIEADDFPEGGADFSDSIQVLASELGEDSDELLHRYSHQTHDKGAP